MATKLKKLIKNPGLFFRDYFIKKYPVEKEADINRTTKPSAANQNISLSDQPQPAGIMQPRFAVDFVYTWVDIADEDFLSELSKHLVDAGKAAPKAATDNARFESRDELKYSIRSVLAYAPWVNHIYIVTNGQIPNWLDINHPKISVVPHRDIIPEEYLPTFNSHTIESCLHRIPNLSEHYVYFNDDVMLTRPVEKSTFFTESGLSLLFRTNSRLPNGPLNDSDTPTQWACKNSRSLIWEKYGTYLDAMFARTFHPQRKSVAELNEIAFSDAIAKSRVNKFRSKDDLLFTSFLCHHIAYLEGKGLLAKTHGYYFNVRSISAKNYYKKLLSLKGTNSAPYSMCLNDVSTKSKWPEYDLHLREFLEEYYPDESEAELPVFTIGKKRIAKT